MYNKLFVPLQHSTSGILLDYYLVYFCVIIYTFGIDFLIKRICFRSIVEHIKYNLLF